MVEKEQVVNVEVAGGYSPQEINLKKEIPAEITFMRTSDQGCLDIVHSERLGFNEQLPLNESRTVKIDTTNSGEFTFSCGMDMFRGKVVIS